MTLPLIEMQIVTNGFPGAPGYTNLYFMTDVATFLGPVYTACETFATDLIGIFPTSWSAKVRSENRVIDAVTGALIDYVTPPGDAPAVHIGIDGGSYGAGVAGACVTLNTDGIGWTRRLRGRTYMVPLSREKYDPDGTLTPSALVNTNATVQHLIDAACGFAVWSRPRNKTGGKAALVVSCHTNDRAAFLSSRRS